MTIRRLVQLGLSLLFLAVVAGCSSGGSLKCRINPSSCMHEGSYEQGEEEYAEEEAKDLNREAAGNVRTRSSWW